MFKTKQIKILAFKQAVSFTLALLVFMSFMVPRVSAQSPDSSSTIKESICSGIGFALEGSSGSSDCADPEGAPRVDSVVTSVINLLSLAIGAISVIMMIVGGLKYVSSQGDSSALSSAKNTILYAIIGLVIVALSQVTVRFVVDRSTSVPARGGSSVIES